MTLATLADSYHANGYLGAVEVTSADDAQTHRRALEEAEAQLGPMHYIDKVHTVLLSAWELCVHPKVLDLVEQMIGPDILLYNSTYIIKEPGTDGKINWHQDLTYWGLSDPDAQVSMWLALAPATEESGCMRMVPGSHRQGQIDHATNSGDGNLLLKGQYIPDVDDHGSAASEVCELQPGQASFHHGWTIHASGPNRSNDRRIGLNVQYLSPRTYVGGSTELGASGTAILVRGSDEFGYFGKDKAPESNLDPGAVARWRELDAAMKANFQID